MNGDNGAQARASGRYPGFLPLIGTILFLLVGAPLVWGGVALIRAGGSAYYLVAGSLLVITAIFLWRRHSAALWLYAALLLGTILWALGEVGLNCWGLLPRIAGPAILGLWFAIPAVRRGLVQGPRFAGAGLVMPALFVAAFALILGSYWSNRFVPLTTERSAIAVAGDATQWPNYANDVGGSHFTTAAQITPTNTAQLQQAWIYHTGETVIPGGPPQVALNFEVTPIKIGDALYLCTSQNTAIAIDADTGKELWRYDPKLNPAGLNHRVCRGLSYAATGGTGLCAQRLLMGTIDDRLIALDLATGKPCPDFGEGGTVDLKQGLGPFPPAYHFITSPPAIVRNVAVVGGFVYDNQSTDEPSGVIRGYDITSGKLLWAWDVLHPDPVPLPLKPGEVYAHDTPNSWTVASGDEKLGIVFLATGGPPPDFYGGDRAPDLDKYGSSIVALDAATGKLRWAFQTTHHDVWDYDVGSQPALIDFDTPQGRRPAVLAPTKRGEIFILDRLTGKPLTKVVERKVPTNDPPAGERLSPTQPYSTGFPSFAPPDLTEASMWGATPIDQMMCRLAFRSHRYDGQYTPGSTRGAIHYPGSVGALDWGSAAIDPARGIAIVNASWMPFADKLIPRATASAEGIVPANTPPGKVTSTPYVPPNPHAWTSAQQGTPFAVETSPFISPLGFPCHQPPWGWIAAIDMKTRRILWKQPFGNSRRQAPLGLPLPVGIFNQGGVVTTAGGVTFTGAAVDGYLRAYDTATGRVRWKASLPAGGQANPMSYVSRRTGRQYVVIAAGGHDELGTGRGDAIVAFALPARH
jgi:quinoprotein glucose dehydrogenase/quinate dehydrogenase (quinone)